jgi:hypothetical protein
MEDNLFLSPFFVEVLLKRITSINKIIILINELFFEKILTLRHINQ